MVTIVHCARRFHKKMIYPVLFTTLSLLKLYEAAPLSPSGGIEGSKWFEQMSSAINQPPKPSFQDPGMKQPFQETAMKQPFQDPSVKQPFQDPGANQPFQAQPNIPNPGAPNVGQVPPSGFQQAKNAGFEPEQPSLFQMLFGPFLYDQNFVPQPQGFQNQQASDFKGQQAKGFEAAKPAGMESPAGSGFQNAGFQPQQSQQPQAQAPNTGFQQPNVDPGFQPQPNAGFQGQQTNPGFQAQGNTGFQGQQTNPGFQAQGNTGFQGQQTNPGFQAQGNTGFQGQQPGYEAPQNPTFNDPMQSEVSLFNNILRNFLMW